jgi:predicted phage-related endonuclease
MAVVNGEAADIAVLFGLGWAFEVYHVPRDEAFIAELTEAEREFWFSYVVPKQPPPIDHTDAARRFLNRSHPKDNGLILPATPEQAELVTRYRLADQNVAQAEQERDRLKNRLIEVIGDAAGLRGSGFELTYKNVKEGKPKVAWELVWAGAKRLMAELGLPEDDERLATLVSLYTEPGRGAYRRWNLADKEE